MGRDPILFAETFCGAVARAARRAAARAGEMVLRSRIRVSVTAGMCGAVARAARRAAARAGKMALRKYCESGKDGAPQVRREPVSVPAGRCGAVARAGRSQEREKWRSASVETTGHLSVRALEPNPPGCLALAMATYRSLGCEIPAPSQEP